MPSRRDEDPVLSSSPLIANRGDGQANNKKVKKSTTSAAGKNSNGGIKLMLTIAVIGLVLLAVWIAELQKQLQASSNLLISYQENMQVIEQRLSITDESMMQSDTQFEDKVKILDSEVRKLWDNVWKKTKTELAKHDKELATQNSKIASQNKIIASLKKNNSSINAKLGSNQIAISAINEQLYTENDNAISIEKLQSQMTALAQSLKAVKESAGNLTAQQRDLIKRMSESEEWVEAFNGYRKEVNQKLLRLEGVSTQ
jgi:chromosome segregation ATPase